MKNNQTTSGIKQAFINNKFLWIFWGIIIVVIIFALYSMGRFDALLKKGTPESKQETSSEGCQPGFNYDVYTGKPCPKEVNGEKKVEPAPISGEAAPNTSSEATPAPAPASTSSNSKYPSLAEALKIYAGNTFRVAAGCTIDPATRTVAPSARIMVHNDTKTVRTVVVGSTTLVLKPYYYRTVPITSGGTTYIKCDGQQAGTVTVR